VQIFLCLFRTYTVRDNVRVTVQTALGVSILTALLTCKVPDDQSLVAGCREEHVGAANILSVLFLVLFFLILFHLFYYILVP